MPGEPARLLCHQRVDQLAARVRWLDRYRRILAICAATMIAPILIARVAAVLGADWPQIHATVLSIMLGVIVWWIIEVGLVYVTALWRPSTTGWSAIAACRAPCCIGRGF